VSNPELERLAGARYISVTTYRRDGTPVATPVWVVSEGGYLQVVTARDAGKVKRLRHNPAVAIAPCDFRGGLQGDPVDATASVIEDPDLIDRAKGLIVSRYGIVGRFFIWLAKVRKEESVVLAIDVPKTAS
jgi:PPOX class probable F420-dependent enzyme